MKNILKKNQVIITALVIMIAVAGYLNFTQDKVGDMAGKNNDAITTSADGNTLDPGDGTDLAGLSLDEDGNEVVDVPDDMDPSDVADVDDTDISDTADAADADPDGDLMDLSAQDLGEDDVLADASEDTSGEAVLVSNTIGADYFASAKLNREQTRAKNKEMLMDLIENAGISEEQKQDAVNNVVGMTEIAEKESAAEILLEAKGFEDVVVSIVDGSADVIVNAANLTEQQMAQVEDIVKRKTGISVENIVITPVGVEQ